MATSAVFAKAAAEAGSVPGSYWTFARGAAARMAFKGDVGNQMGSSHAVLPFPGGMIAFPPGGSTWADPPPEIMPTSACVPITAMLAIFETSRGSCERSFPGGDRQRRRQTSTAGCGGHAHPVQHRRLCQTPPLFSWHLRKRFRQAPRDLTRPPT